MARRDGTPHIIDDPEPRDDREEAIPSGTDPPKPPGRGGDIGLDGERQPPVRRQAEPAPEQRVSPDRAANG